MKRVIATFAIIAAALGAMLPMAASALTFSPPTFDFSANPGDVIDDAIRVYNEGFDPLTLRVQAVNFTAKPGDETDGIPEFYPADEPRDGHGLAPWISFVNDEITVASGERGSLHFQIRVPSDAGPGSYFGAAVVTSETPKAEQGVGLVGNTAVLILLKVNGDAVEDMKLTSFSVTPKISSSLPAEFEARVENLGTVHLRPFGDIRIKNMLGRVVAVVPMNRAEYKSVLPGGARRYSARWLKRELQDEATTWERQSGNFAFGRYTAELSMEYGLQKTVVTARSTFWVIPWMVLGAALGGLAVTLVLIVMFLRWYRNKIIAQVERQKPQA